MSKASIDIIKCGECLAFVMKNGRFGQGECHRYAPHPSEREDVLWPRRLASEPGCWEGIKSAVKNGDDFPSENEAKEKTSAQTGSAKTASKAEEW